MLNAFLQMDCFYSNITLFRYSSSNLKVTIGNYNNEVCKDVLLDNSEIALFSEDCEFYSTYSGRVIFFHNQSCLSTNQTFYKLVIKNNDLDSNFTVYVSNIVDSVLDIKSCIDTIRFYYSRIYDLELHLKFVCPQIQVNSDIQIYLYHDEKEIFQYTFSELLTFEITKQLILDFSEETVKNIIANDSYIGYYSITFKQDKIVIDQSSGLPSQVQNQIQLDGTLPISLFNEAPCFENVELQLFQQDIIMSYQKGFLCSNQDSSYFKQFSADSLMLTISFYTITDVLIGIQQNETNPQFSTQYYYFQCQQDCSKYLLLSGMNINDIAIVSLNIFFIQDQKITFVIRQNAKLIPKLFEEISATLRNNEICVYTNAMKANSSQIKEYGLLIKKSVRSKKSHLNDQIFVSFSDFFPLDQYCFDITIRKGIEQIYSSRYSIIFIMDKQQTEIYQIEPEHYIQFGFTSLAVGILIIILMLLGFVILNYKYVIKI